ncbi:MULTISPECIES: MFS transporter [Amycolatopsis]|uniref:MFS transporter n=1 Tax=Amycolatopsis bullii TaxID=941987 RepID=A0ABQ3KDI2_9PSEU|nr:MFS transporter [Amycolatopsis bullii]GHG14323.1 MFS transporter [Amycolatopsis bullii]
MTTTSTQRDGNRAKAGLLVVCAAHFLIGADGLAVAITMPHVQQTFAAEAIDTQWVLTGYGVVFGGLILVGGRLGDLYGRRLLLTGGMLVFAIGSSVAGLAPALGWLVAGRLLQGLGAAAAVPAALALIGSMYPPGPARARALSLLAAMTTIGVMSGLVIGGAVIDGFGWRWLFLGMTVPSIIAGATVPLVLPETGRQRIRLDLGGAVLASTGLGAVLYGLVGVEQDGIGASRPLLSLLAGVLLLGGFVLRERRAPAPLLRFDILRVRSLRAGSLGIGANGVAFTSIVFAGTLYLQNGLGYSALHAAFAILPIDAVAFTIALVARPVARYSPRAMLAVCFALTAVSLLWLARCPVPANYFVDLLPPMVVLGVALTIVFVVTTQQAVADVEPEDKGLASGIYETANHLSGGAIGVAVYAAVVSAVASDAHDPAGYRAAFLVATAMVVVLGVAAVSQSTPRGKLR